MTKKKIIFTVLGLLILISVIAAIKVSQIITLMQLGENSVEPSVTISSIDVKPYQWESTLTAIGSLEAAKGLDVSADLSGRITKIAFDAGTEVSAGDLLVEQDISTETAQLRAAKSETILSKNNFDRVKQLHQRKVASQSEYDNAKNAYQSALAAADNIRAAIEKKSIRAPFSGRLGIRLVNLGQSINAGQPVVSLQSTELMFVNFFLPQQNLPLLQKGLTVRLRTDAVPNKIFVGTINAINPEIDSDTRSVEIQALLANPENQLLSGMFTNIEVVLPELEDVLIVPVTAVKYATYGASVFVIEPQVKASTVTPPKTDQDSVVAVNDTAEQWVVRQQFVRLGETRGDYAVVTKGLSSGQRIVSTGVFKLRNGAPIVINNDIVPEFSLKPSLDDR